MKAGRVFSLVLVALVASALSLGCSGGMATDPNPMDMQTVLLTVQCTPTDGAVAMGANIEFPDGVVSGMDCPFTIPMGFVSAIPVTLEVSGVRLAGCPTTAFVVASSPLATADSAVLSCDVGLAYFHFSFPSITPGEGVILHITRDSSNVHDRAGLLTVSAHTR